MSLEIERPDWRELECLPTSIRSKMHLLIHMDRLNDAFDAVTLPINKLLREGFEVSGNYGPDDEYGSRWYDFDNTKACHKSDTHSALLINIQKIVELTREQKLEECLLSALKDPDFIASKLPDWKAKAIKLLGDK